MNKKILVVFNICGIKFNNIEMWVNHLNDIIEQDYPNYKIVVSGCKINESSKAILTEIKNQHNNIILNWIEDILPISVTCNQTVQVCEKEFGPFDAYLYVASDVKFKKYENDRKIINKLVEVHYNSNSAMTLALVDNDHGLDGIYSDCWDKLDKLLETDHFCVNLGRASNMHVVLFDKEIYNAFDNRIIPDIFASHHIETTFAYIAASLGKKFVVHNRDIILGHIGFADGHSVGFMDEIKWDHTISWKHFFKSKISAEERLLNDEAKNCGFGYGEAMGLLPHREDLYDSDENHINPSLLLNFLKKAIFLLKDEFNYETINYTLIK